MNKKTEKILIGIGLGLLGIFGGYKLVKAYRKGMEELENQELKEIEDLENAGVNTSKLREEIDDDEKDFSRMLFAAVRNNSEIDEDLFDADLALDKLNEQVIHVRQRFDTKNKYGESLRRLDFLIDIPDYTMKGYRGPKIGNFLSAFSQAANTMSDEIVKFSYRAKQNLIGKVIITREIDGVEVVEYRELKNVVYKEFADEKHDGLTEFFRIEEGKINELGARKYTEDAKWLFINCPDLNEDDPTLIIESLLLQYRISFPIRSNKPGELYGIDIKTAIDCIKYLTEEMTVGREGSNIELTYQNLMFDATTDEDNQNSLQYYIIDENTGKIKTELFAGFED